MPFESRDPIELIHHHLALVPVPPAEIRPGIPAVVDAIIGRLLRKNADDRYQSAADVRVTLETPMIAQAESGSRKRPRRLVPLALIFLGWAERSRKAAIQQLGDPSFMQFYGVDYAYSTGAMANGIASEEMVIALGKANLLGSFAMTRTSLRGPARQPSRIVRFSR